MPRPIVPKIFPGRAASSSKSMEREGLPTGRDTTRGHTVEPEKLPENDEAIPSSVTRAVNWPVEAMVSSTKPFQEAKEVWSAAPPLPTLPSPSNPA